MACSHDIFALRKEDKLAEALKLTRECLSQDATDPWTKRAAGWVFYDHCKQAMKDQDIEQSQAFLAEFDALQLSSEEKMIHDQINRLRVQLLTQTGAADKPKNPPALVKYYRDLAEKFPENTETIGWEIYKELKVMGETNPASSDIALEFLRLYAHLSTEKPSLLHSQILNLALKLIDKPVKLLDFIKWWNLDHLRPEDFERQVFEDHTYNSLAEKVATAFSKGIENQPHAEDTERALSFLDQVSQQHPDNIWLKHHKGKLLTLVGRFEEARALVIPVVRSKLTESWAWELLAETYPNDPDKALACLCRALQANKEEQYLVGIRLHLAGLLAQQEEYGPAKFEVEKVKQVYEEQGWKLKAEVNALLNAPWYAGTTATANNGDLYQTYRAVAEALVLADLPFINGVISRQQPEQGDKPGRAFISYKDGETMAAIPIKHKQFKWLKKAELGLPVAFQLTDDVGRLRVLTLERRQAELWDVFESFTGRFKAVKLIGFVKDSNTGRDIFIPSYLVEAHHLADGQTISGRAEYGEDPKKKQLGWRAVAIL